MLKILSVFLLSAVAVSCSAVPREQGLAVNATELFRAHIEGAAAVARVASVVCDSCYSDLVIDPAREFEYLLGKAAIYYRENSASIVMDAFLEREICSLSIFSSNFEFVERAAPLPGEVDVSFEVFIQELLRNERISCAAEL
ncbi:hypothetical protein E5163_10945 [Marinicauda algicola]|uniref:Uncharacterized protein n=1 Tax=Marinicauda algicola TaxID=2029849 RepID=A0A4S2GZF7_9PROT|nr:hypothetical protein [Marinicauda algicola]TGY88331.1 hypothetical protein E5163_10945 [Marinicauda algicola]